jgi:hypothetical protein
MPSSRVCVSARRISERRISEGRVSARARPRVLSVACARSGGRRKGWMHGRNRMHVLKNRDHGARLFVSRPRHRWEQIPINTRPECTEYNPGMRRRGMMDGSGPERGTRQQSIRWKRVPDAPSERAGGLGRGELAVFCSRRCRLALVAKQRLRSFHANQPVRVTGILSSSARHLLLLKPSSISSEQAPTSL